MVESPFVFNGIPFEPVSAGHTEVQSCPWNLPPGPPLVLWIAGSRDPGQMKVEDMTDLVLDAVTDEIQRLTGGGSPAPGPQDIAVLVRTNEQARRFKKRLDSARIPAVLFSAGSVFGTREARTMQRLLTAVADPGEIGSLKAALATELFGVCGEQLAHDVDSGWLAEQQTRFRDDQTSWQQHGFIAMFRRLADREKFRLKLLRFTDGERRLTNLLHLSELLQQASMEHQMSPADLIAWLQEQRNGADNEAESHQLRLESDARAVTILTVHKSKGLEFPIVFCPFSWQGVAERTALPIFHDPDAEDRLTLDLGSEMIVDHQRLNKNESLAEGLRLLYVSVTRAKQRCYLAWGRTTHSARAPLGYLLHADASCLPAIAAGAGENAVANDLLAALKIRLKSVSASERQADLDRLQSTSGGNIGVVPLPETPQSAKAADAGVPGDPLACRKFGRSLASDWRVSSYSSLVFSGDCAPAVREPEFPDPAADPGQDKPVATGKADLASFPRGTRAGLFFHELLEHVDRPAGRPEAREHLVRRTLEKYGFESDWQAVVERMLDAVLSTPLAPGEETFSLDDVPAHRQIREMEFYFPLKHLSRSRLKQVFESLTTPSGMSAGLGRLAFAPTRGFMRGFIDLVFSFEHRYYLLDWKSNHLGSGPNSYGDRQLAAAMANGNYFLQYHLYALAMHRYLSKRVSGYRYETHFGGVFYVFLRGVDRGGRPGAGIYMDRPDSATIAALDRALIG
jgi:exodeoxyribonuclease V beta subunit